MRLFVAIFPPADAIEDLSAALDPVRSGLRRWIPADRWHLTLSFLGEQPESALDRLTAGLADVGWPVPLPLRLAGGGQFARGRSGVVWVGVAGDGLGELASSVRRATRAPREHNRRFAPHLTVGRWRSPEQPSGGLLPVLADYLGPAWTAREAHLVRSHLGPTPRYERLAAWPLSTEVDNGYPSGASPG